MPTKRKIVPRPRPRESITAPAPLMPDPVSTALAGVIQRQLTLLETLTAQLVELKRNGFQPKPPEPKKRKTRPPEISDELLVRQRDEEVVSRMKSAFIAQGASPAAAEKEARRIRRESTRTTEHPSDQA